MARGHQVEREVDRAEACANCGRLRFFEFPKPSYHGSHGFHFCRLLYGESGEFTNQPWDFTCEDFKVRGQSHDKDKCVHGDEVPVVRIPEGVFS